MVDPSIIMDLRPVVDPGRLIGQDYLSIWESVKQLQSLISGQEATIARWS